MNHYAEYLKQLAAFNPWKPETLPDGSVLQLTPHGHVLRENNVVPLFGGLRVKVTTQTGKGPKIVDHELSAKATVDLHRYLRARGKGVKTRARIKPKALKTRTAKN